MKFNYNFIRMHANMTDICKFGKMFEFTYTTPPSRKKSQQINDYRYINLLLSNANKKLQIQKRSFTTQKNEASYHGFLRWPKPQETVDLVTFTEEILNPNKTGLFEGNFFWAGGQFDPLFIFQLLTNLFAVFWKWNMLTSSVISWCH